MNTEQLSQMKEFTPVVLGDTNDIKGVYCCDLLSHVMGQSLEGNVWCTVMANINSLAVASLTDAACVILCHGLKPSEDMVERAKKQYINLFTTELSQFEAGMLVVKTSGIDI